jgi:hypothetical protein
MPRQRELPWRDRLGDANLYDFNYQPKPAYYSTLAALQNGK